MSSFKNMLCFFPFSLDILLVYTLDTYSTDRKGLWSWSWRCSEMHEAKHESVTENLSSFHFFLTN